nr:MAG TPA: hypothetical protein [Caudoviricetes sp.]
MDCRRQAAFLRQQKKPLEGGFFVWSNMTLMFQFAPIKALR